MTLTQGKKRCKKSKMELHRRDFLHFGFLAAAAVLASSCQDEGFFSVDPLFADGAILQQHSTVVVKGKASPGTHVMITTDWDYSVTSSAGADSIWEATLSTPEADTLRHAIKFSTKAGGSLVRDILIGEVWTAVGQTGESPLPDVCHVPDSAAAEETPTEPMWPDPLVRIFRMEPGAAARPQSESRGGWASLTEGMDIGLNNGALTFAKILRDSLRIPIGVILASCADAPSRAWENPKLLGYEDEAERELEIWREKHAECVSWLATLPMLETRDDAGRNILGELSVYDEYMNISKLNPRQWPSMRLPGLWGRDGLPGFDGVVWFVKNVELPPGMPRRAKMRIVLGGLADNDLTYVNQALVGHSYDTTATLPRGTYDIPADLTQSGHLTINIRLDGHHETAGIYGPPDGSPMRIETPDGSKSVRIDGEWAYCAAAHFTAGDSKVSLMGMPDNRYMSEFRNCMGLPLWLRGAVYNKMLAPLQGFAVAGVLCHMGEADMSRPSERRDMTAHTKQLVKTLRATFGRKDLPIYMSQIPTMPRSTHGGGGDARQAQVDAVNQLDGKVGLISLIDLATDPRFPTQSRRQAEEGRRMAAAALADVYSLGSPHHGSCPMPRKAVRDHQVVNVWFDHADGLRIDTSLPSAFEVAGPDSVFRPAKALASGDWVTMFSHMVMDPRYVRYAYADSVRPTLWNGAGLPSPGFAMTVSEPAAANDD